VNLSKSALEEVTLHFYCMPTLSSVKFKRAHALAVIRKGLSHGFSPLIEVHDAEDDSKTYPT
jgi:hypothetical protein